MNLDSHTVGSSWWFYTAFSLLSMNGNFQESFHLSNAQHSEKGTPRWLLAQAIITNWFNISKPSSRVPLLSKHFFLKDVSVLIGCFLCVQKKRWKGNERITTQVIGPRSRYEPYWTCQVQTGPCGETLWRLSFLPKGLHQGEAAIPQSKTADKDPHQGTSPATWRSTQRSTFMETKIKIKKKEHITILQTQTALTVVLRQWQCDNIQCYFMVAVWEHYEFDWAVQLNQDICTNEVILAHLKDRDTGNNSQKSSRLGLINIQPTATGTNTVHHNTGIQKASRVLWVVWTPDCLDYVLTGCLLSAINVGFCWEGSVKTHIYIDICMRVDIKIPVTGITEVSSCSVPLVILQETAGQRERGCCSSAPIGHHGIPSHSGAH